MTADRTAALAAKRCPASPVRLSPQAGRLFGQRYGPSPCDLSGNATGRGATGEGLGKVEARRYKHRAEHHSVGVPTHQGAKMAATGHMSTQRPHSVQISASMLNLTSPSLMAPTGHSVAHTPQATHSSLMSYDKHRTPFPHGLEYVVSLRQPRPDSYWTGGSQDIPWGWIGRGRGQGVVSKGDAASGRDLRLRQKRREPLSQQPPPGTGAPGRPVLVLCQHEVMPSFLHLGAWPVAMRGHGNYPGQAFLALPRVGRDDRYRLTVAPLGSGPGTAGRRSARWCAGPQPSATGRLSPMTHPD